MRDRSGEGVAPPTPVEIAAVDEALLRFLRPLGDLVARYHQAEITGLDRLPRAGGALLVANHGLFGVDAFVLGLEIWKRTGRMPRGLMEHFFFRIPPLAALMQRFGAIRGDRAHGAAALRQGEWVLVYPGGAREVNKTSADQRYKLLWGRAKGFVRLAVETQAPLHFVAGTGIDDTFEILGAMPGGLARLLLGHERYALPIVRPALPRRVPFRFDVSEAQPLGLPPGAAQDDAAIDRVHADLWRRCQGYLDAQVGPR